MGVKMTILGIDISKDKFDATVIDEQSIIANLKTILKALGN